MLHQLNYHVPVFKLMMVKEPALKKPKARSSHPVAIKSAQDAAKLFNPLSFASEEYFVALHLNSKFEVIGLHEVSHGTLSASLVHPREVFKAALVANSYAILVCHNHPSGAGITPSAEDLATTRTLIEAGRLLGVSVLDHIILGPQQQSKNARAFSFREEHPHLWEAS